MNACLFGMCWLCSDERDDVAAGELKVLHWMENETGFCFAEELALRED